MIAANLGQCNILLSGRAWASAQLFGQHPADFRFHHALHRRQQETQLGLHPHRAGQHLDRALDAGTGEMQLLPLPADADVEALLQLARNLGDGLARAFVGQGMGMADVDAGHGGLCARKGAAL